MVVIKKIVSGNKNGLVLGQQVVFEPGSNDYKLLAVLVSEAALDNQRRFSLETNSPLIVQEFFTWTNIEGTTSNQWLNEG